MHKFTLTVLFLLAAIATAQAAQVGWSVDIHQNQFQPCADDFHVWACWNPFLEKMDRSLRC